MALTTTHIQLFPVGLRDQIDRFFVAIGQGMNAYMERRSHMREIMALNAKTDEELAALGITRDTIPHHVFRDIYYL